MLLSRLKTTCSNNNPHSITHAIHQAGTKNVGCICHPSVRGCFQFEASWAMRYSISVFVLLSNIDEFSNMNWLQQIFDSNELDRWFPVRRKTLWWLMIEELQEWGRINGCCNMQSYWLGTWLSTMSQTMSVPMIFRNIFRADWTHDLKITKIKMPKNAQSVRRCQ